MVDKCICIMHTIDDKDIFLHELSIFNYFIRSTIKIFLEAICKEFRDRSADGIFKYEIIEHSTTYYMIGFKFNTNTVIAVTIENPPHNHINCMIYEIHRHGLKSLIKDNFDYINSQMKINMVTKEIIDMKINIVNDIEKVIKNGEKIDDILQKTQYLEEDSKKILESSDKLSSKCCLIL